MAHRSHLESASLCKFVPDRHAAFDAIKALTLKLSLLGLRVQREGLRPIGRECEQTLDEIIRLLAVLNGPDTEGDPA